MIRTKESVELKSESLKSTWEHHHSGGHLGCDHRAPIWGAEGEGGGGVSKAVRLAQHMNQKEDT